MSRSWRWIARASSLAALLAALPFPVRSAVDSAATRAVVADAGALETGDEELYLAVSLNQFDTGRLARFVLRDHALFASSSTLQALGLKWSRSEEHTSEPHSLMRHPYA